MDFPPVDPFCGIFGYFWFKISSLCFAKINPQRTWHFSSPKKVYTIILWKIWDSDFGVRYFWTTLRWMFQGETTSSKPTLELVAGLLEACSILPASQWWVSCVTRVGAGDHCWKSKFGNGQTALTCLSICIYICTHIDPIFDHVPTHKNTRFLVPVLTARMWRFLLWRLARNPPMTRLMWWRPFSVGWLLEGFPHSTASTANR